MNTDIMISEQVEVEVLGKNKKNGSRGAEIAIIS